eukprot:scpid107480/ scgid35622/ 
MCVYVLFVVLTGLVKYISEDPAMKLLNPYILPKLISQDFVESYFSVQRSEGGSSSHMTASRYSYNSKSIEQTHVLPGNLGHRACSTPVGRVFSNSADLPE